jgi:UDP-N-acetylglucosamine 4,6-dehydratase/5-epimerase
MIPTGVEGKTVLITGGTGSFGKAFVKRILGLPKDAGPHKVIIFSRDELKQYEMAQEITDPRVRFFIGDVRDRDRLYRAFEGVDVVVHAAALKQVPAAEYNPAEAIKTNVLGAMNVIDAAIDRKVQTVVALSTDKAVSPVNLYGATKLCSDKLFVAANAYSGPSGCHFSVVRYGNVVGSRGSVIPFFLRARETGRVYPVTDERMTRFWITMDKATSLVLNAIRLCEGGEILVPKIPSMGIMDLVRAMDPQGTVQITGIRPGEKLHETLISEEEAQRTVEWATCYAIYPHGQPRDGAEVPKDFCYRSDTNPWQLSAQELGKYFDISEKVALA